MFLILFVFAFISTAIANECTSLLPRLTRQIQAELRLASAKLLIQEGKVEFTGGSTSSTCSSGSRKTQRDLSCSFQNPSSPYGLIQIPESPGKTKPSSFRAAQSSTTKSPMTQLRSDESILLFGCLPPANASRYFAATGYLYSAYDNSTSKWINTFGSIGDSLHVIRQPVSNYGLKRINAGLPSDQSSSVRASSGPLLLGGVSRSRGWVPRWQSSISDFVTASSGDDSSLPPSGFDAFTAIILTADPRQGSAISSILKKVLAAAGISNAINILPIPRPIFSDALGLDPLSSYYMLLLRNILPPSPGAAAIWSSYASSGGLNGPWTVLRLTPVTQDLSPSPGFPLPVVIPRQPPPSVNQSEAWLKPAFSDLMARVAAKYSQGNSLSWSLGSTSYLTLLGIDYGKDCVVAGIDSCQGDNRDATYISSFPFIELSSEGKVVWLLGVNHVMTGSASWMSISITDPIAKTGLEAFDDEEVAGSANELMQGSKYESLSPYLFAVQFARDCTGALSKYCKVIPTSGSKSLPTHRPGLVMMRSYVNSATGVGPVTDHMITFRTVVISPSSARSYNIIPQTSGIDLLSSPCAADMLKASTCLSGAGKFCCSAVAAFNIGGCFCSADGKKVVDLLPSGMGKAAILGANVMCGTRSNVNC